MPTTSNTGVAAAVTRFAATTRRSDRARTSATGKVSPRRVAAVFVGVGTSAVVYTGCVGGAAGLSGGTAGPAAVVACGGVAGGAGQAAGNLVAGNSVTDNVIQSGLIGAGTAGVGVLAGRIIRPLGRSAALDDIGPVTVHGADRVAGAGATRGGVLTTSEIVEVRAVGQVFTQSNGATAKVLEAANGRFNVVVDGDRGFITSFSNLSQNSIDRLAKNHGWVAQ